MMKILLVLLLNFLVTPLGFGTARKVEPTIKYKKPFNPNNGPLLPLVPPVEITYDPDTREIEITGDDSEGVEIQIFDDCGNWLITLGRTPCSYTLTTTRPDYVYVHMDSYDWSATAAIQVK